MKYSANALVAGAALAAGTANSLMIAPSMLDAETLDEKAKSEFGLNIAQILDPQTTSRLVKINCPGCAFPVEGKDGVYTLEKENDLIFDFKTTQDRKALLLNDKQFFPVDPLGMDLQAGQSAAGVSFDELRSHFDRHVSGPRPLDYALNANEIEAADGADAKLIDIEFQALGLGEQPITVDGLTIRLLSDEQGAISIVDIIQDPHNGGVAHEVAAEPSEGEEQAFKILPFNGELPPRPPSIRPHHKPRPSCDGPAAFFCRWAQLVEDKMSNALRPLRNHGPKRPCPGMMRGHGHGKGKPNHIPIKGGIPKFLPWKYTPEAIKNGEPVKLDQGVQSTPQGHPHPHPHYPHHTHEAPMFHHFSQAVRRVFFGFFVPVMIGVAAGMTASLIGMLVGTLIAYAWIQLVRGGRRGYEQVEQVTEEESGDAVKDEKHSLVPADAKDEEEPLPVYSERQE